LLSGMPGGDNVSEMYSENIGAKRYLGHFFVAMRIDCFEEISVFKKRMVEMVRALRSEPRREKDIPVQVPGDPEKKIAKIRMNEGIPISRQLLDKFGQISKEYNVAFNI